MKCQTAISSEMLADVAIVRYAMHSYSDLMMLEHNVKACAIIHWANFSSVNGLELMPLSEQTQNLLTLTHNSQT